MSEALRHLRSEHQSIVELLISAEQVAVRVETGKRVASAVLYAFVDIFRLYAHGIHHEKEENVLYRMLREKGVNEGPGCVAVMLAEHDEGEAAYNEMARQADAYAEGDANAAALWAAATRKYCVLLRNHIRREDDIVFAVAERSLSDADLKELSEAIEKIDEKARRSGIYDRLGEAQELARAAVAG